MATEKQIKANLKELAALKAETAESVARMKELEKRVRAATAELGESVEGHGVVVTFVKASERTKWDPKTLEAMAESLPEILEAKKTVTSKATARIKVGGY